MTLKDIHHNQPLQLILGAGIGVLFGFLLQRGQATNYGVILGQLMLRDFTVIKIMLTAIVTGMVGIFFLNRTGWVRYHIKKGSFGASIIGGLIFGAGMALLGYCPGTNGAAVGQGSLDALLGGVPGLIAGTILYAMIYPLFKSPCAAHGGIWPHDVAGAVQRQPAKSNGRHVHVDHDPVFWPGTGRFLKPLALRGAYWGIFRGTLFKPMGNRSGRWGGLPVVDNRPQMPIIHH